MTEDAGPGPLGRTALRCQPDSRLVALTREGSDAAFEEVVGRYQSRLVGFAAGIVEHDRAEDVVQESLMKALSSIRGTATEINLRPWLYTIVRNRAINNLRDEPTYEHLDEDYDGVPQPPDVAARHEELASVVGQVKALPDAQRRALVERELEGRSHEEIAAGMDVTPGAVRGLIFRARTSLRDVAGILIPMPVLRAVAGTSAGGGAATVAAAGGGGGFVKLGATVGVAVVAIGSGVALHDRGASRDDPGQAKISAQESADVDSSPAPAGSTTQSGSGTAIDSGRGSSSAERSAGGADSGPSDSSGPRSAGSGGSTGPSPASGSSGPTGGSGSGRLSGDGGEHGGPAPREGGPVPGDGGDGGADHHGPAPGDGGGGAGPGGLASGGGTHEGPSDGGSGSGDGGSGGGLPPPPSGDGGGDGSSGGDGSGSGSSDGSAWPLPPLGD